MRFSLTVARSLTPPPDGLVPTREGARGSRRPRKQVPSVPLESAVPSTDAPRRPRLVDAALRLESALGSRLSRI